MKHCMKESLIKCNHPVPKKPCHSPHANKLPTHGAKIQCADAPDESPELNEVESRKIQAIIRSLLCYSRAAHNNLLVALNAITMKTHSPTTFTLQEVHHQLNYVATHPDNGTLFRASKMQLSAHSDARFLNEAKARSRASAHVHLSENVPIPAFNGAVLTIAQTIKFVMSSAVEAELASMCITKL